MREGDTQYRCVIKQVTLGAPEAQSHRGVVGAIVELFPCLHGVRKSDYLSVNLQEAPTVVGS